MTKRTIKTNVQIKDWARVDKNNLSLITGIFPNPSFLELSGAFFIMLVMATPVYFALVYAIS